ncbi:MAG: hypothetical protein V8R75_07175 [Oscillospiraceae bacterium]
MAVSPRLSPLFPCCLPAATAGPALADFILYVLFAPACRRMIYWIMYASESVMEADEP